MATLEMEQAEFATRPSEPQAAQRAEPVVPVIALGEGMTLLEVITLLAKANIPRYVSCPQNDFVRFSRWYRKLPYKDGALSPASLAADLLHLDVERAVLLPCSDDWVSAVASLPPTLRSRFPSSTASAEVVDILVDKWRFAQKLLEQKIPHPRTRLIRSYEELASIPAAEFHGRILKPPSSSAFTRKYRVKGYVLKDRDHALRIMAEKEFPIMLQEFIAGPSTSTCLLDGFVDQNGTIAGVVARRQLRNFPSDLGNTTVSATIPRLEVAPAERALRKFLAAIRYRGIFSAEFKYDKRDGLMKLLEINARPWWYVEFTARCGLDVCATAYRDALGLPVRAVGEYVTGRRCVYYVNDLRAWWAQHRSGVGLRQWVQLWLGAMETPFRWSDPGPALMFPFSLLRNRKARLEYPLKKAVTGVEIPTPIESP